VVNKLKWELFSQNQDETRDVNGFLMEDNTSFFGLINKIDYTYGLGRLDLQPRFKSEFLRQTAFLAAEDKREEWVATAELIVTLPVLRHTVVLAGLEQLWFSDRVQDEDALVAAGRQQETGDLSSTNIAVLVSTTSAYLGYQLTTQIGLRYGRILTEQVIEDSNRPGTFVIDDESSNETTSFITVFAGLE
jgi:hypothetical protein